MQRAGSSLCHEGSRVAAHGLWSSRTSVVVLPPSAQEPVPFLHKGCSPGDQASRAPMPGGLIWRTQSRRPGRQPRRGAQGAGSRGEDVRGPRHSSCVPEPLYCSGGAAAGTHRPLTQQTRAGESRDQPRPGLSGQCSQNSFPLRGRAQAGPSTPGRQESQASSCVEEWNSACLSSCSWDDRPLVE